MLLEGVNAGEGWDLYVPAAEDLTFAELPNPFLGSRNRKLFALRYLDDRLTTARYTDPIPFTRSDNGAPSDPSLLVLPETEEEVITYSVFMGGDIGETVIDTNREDLPTALLIGESYTNALETLLYASFDELHAIDPRSFQGESGGRISSATSPRILRICSPTWSSSCGTTPPTSRPSGDKTHPPEREPSPADVFLVRVRRVTPPGRPDPQSSPGARPHSPAPRPP